MDVTWVVLNFGELLANKWKGNKKELDNFHIINLIKSKNVFS